MPDTEGKKETKKKLSLEQQLEQKRQKDQEEFLKGFEKLKAEFGYDFKPQITIVGSRVSGQLQLVSTR